MMSLMIQALMLMTACQHEPTSDPMPDEPRPEPWPYGIDTNVLARPLVDLRSDHVPSPIDEPCTQCGARPGERCDRRTLGRYRFHMVRVKAFEGTS